MLGLAALALAACGGASRADGGERYELASPLAGRELDQVLLRAARANAPLLVLLHGRDGDESTWLGYGLEDALEQLGDRAPHVLLLESGAASYYHDRRDGRWGSYVLREAIPAALRRLGGARTVAIGGVSMGGFGALDLARLAPRRFCTVGAHSPALWRSGGETPQGAFDDAADFARHDLLDAAADGAAFGRAAVWLDVGEDDPFHAATVELARRLRARGRRFELHVWPGGHTPEYTRAHVDEYLDFYARELARC